MKYDYVAAINEGCTWPGCTLNMKRILRKLVREAVHEANSAYMEPDMTVGRFSGLAREIARRLIP